ncbi:hypothetical protein Tco_0301142 [Tanacetum coccineum]
MWRGSGRDVPRALPWQIGMPRLPFGMIPRTKPEQLKIAKTRQRARSWRALDQTWAVPPVAVSTPSSYHTLFTGYFTRDEDCAIYSLHGGVVMCRLLPSNSTLGCRPYTKVSDQCPGFEKGTSNVGALPCVVEYGLVILRSEAAAKKDSRAAALMTKTFLDIRWSCSFSCGGRADEKSNKEILSARSTAIPYPTQGSAPTCLPFRALPWALSIHSLVLGVTTVRVLVYSAC